jgi:hypothetical protein
MVLWLLRGLNTMQNKTKRVRKVIAKLGWMSFAGYVISSLCGAEKIAACTSMLTVGCAIVVSGMKATDEIQQIVTS